MGFFDSLPHPEPAPRPPRPKRQVWACPEDVIPAYLPFERVLVHTSSLAMFVNNVGVYPDGVEFTVHIRQPRGAEPGRDGALLGSPFERQSPFPRGREAGSSDRYLRLGVEYADGRRTQVDRFHRVGPSVERPVVTYSRGSGGEGRWDQDVWIWGLPEEGPITVFYVWPAEGVAEACFVLDGHELRTAAARARILWPESPSG